MGQLRRSIFVFALVWAMPFAAAPADAQEQLRLRQPRPAPGALRPLFGLPQLPQAVDFNPHPDIFETKLTAREARVDLDGDGATESVYSYNGMVPAPEFRVKVGDTVIVHFENLLPKPSSVHWHGIEVNNASDGTPVTQNSVLTGQIYTYKFVPTRPGVFWYHPHFKPTNDEFKGQYGSFIVEDPREKRLQKFRVLPDRRHTKTLVLSDTTICKKPNENDTVTFPADPDLPWAGDGPFPGNDSGPSPQELCEDPLDDSGLPLGTGALSAGVIPNVQPPASCGQAGASVILTGMAAAGATTGPASFYGIDDAGTLYEVVPMTAEVVEIGPTGFSGTAGLGYDPLTGRLWTGSSSTRQFISIDPPTAASEVEFGFDGFPELRTRDFAFLEDGSLYVVGYSPGTASGARLYSVDRANGQAEQIAGATGQGITALSPTSLLQNTSLPFPHPDQFAVIDLSVDPPTSTPISGWPQVAIATQLTRIPGTDTVYGINGCNAFCSGEVYRYDLAAKTATAVGAPASAGCLTNDGQLVLTNGRIAAGREGSPEDPGALAAGPEVYHVRTGEGVRFQVINAAVSRYFRLKMTDHLGNPVTLYRVGGEGGLLDSVRVEGGVQDNLDTKFERGEIVLGPSDRTDVVAVMPMGSRGDIATLWTLDFSHTRSGYAMVPSVPVAHLLNVGNGPSFERFEIDEDDPLLVHPRVDEPLEDFKGLPILEHLLDPSQFLEPLPGSPDEEIRLTNTDKRPSIDDVNGDFRGRRDDFRLVPHIATSRFARVGDLLELAVSNETGMHHPFHLHGFSFQPLRVEDLSGNTVLTYDYNEFVDTVDIPGRHRLVFRVRLDDRFMMDGATPGGAVGRWLFHCHIAFHAALGMISELVVLP